MAGRYAKKGRGSSEDRRRYIPGQPLSQENKDVIRKTMEDQKKSEDAARNRDQKLHQINQSGSGAWDTYKE